MATTKSFAELKSEIAALQLQADEARQRELSEVIANVKNTISTYGLTLADLGLKGGGGAPKGPKVLLAAKLAPKYRDLTTGKTWVGRGKPPLWIAGRDRTPFLLSQPGAGPSNGSTSAKPVANTSKVSKVLALSSSKSAPAKQVPASAKTVVVNKSPAKKVAAKPVSKTLAKPESRGAKPASKRAADVSSAS